MRIRYTTRLLCAAAIPALAISACSSPESQDKADAPATAHEHDHEHGEGHNDHDHGDGGHPGAEAGETEVRMLPTRVVYTYDGGIRTIDAKTGETVEDVKKDGFLRLNDAGDNRHVMVTRGNEFLTFDSGLVTKPHGDHNHYFTAQPKLTDAHFDADKAGHVVAHDGKTAMFSDGAGKATVVDTEEIADKDAHTHGVDTGAPHHGVTVPLSDGSVVTTAGTEEERHTIRHLDSKGKTLAETTECPGVHGEAAAGGDKLVFGCEDGPVLFDGSQFKKLDASAIAGADGFQHSGTLAGSEESSVVLADNKTDKSAADKKGKEKEYPTSVALIDTENGSVKKVDLGGSYWFRSLARGPLGEGLVLTDDGKLNIIDPKTGEVTKTVDAIDPWQEPEDWQGDGPILKSHGGYAYVSDAKTKKLTVIDLHTGEVDHTVDLDDTAIEMEVL